MHLGALYAASAPAGGPIGFPPHRWLVCTLSVVSNQPPIPRPTIKRLSHYLRALDSYLAQGRSTISSRQLGQAIGITDAQVRKDLGNFGQLGQPGIGYAVTALREELRRILKIDRVWNAVVVGVGNIGRAILSYPHFAGRGFNVVGAFDADGGRVGETVAGVRILSMDELSTVITELDVRIGILTVPAEAAQDVDRGPVVEAQRLAGAADDEEARRADAPAAHGPAPPPVDCTGSGLLRGGLHVVVHVLPHGSLARGRLAERAREAHAHGLRPRQLQHQNHALPEAALLREAVVVPRHEQAPSSQILPHVLRARRRERERRVADVARRRPRRAAARALWRAPRDRRQGPGVVAADLPLPPPQTPDVDPLQRAVALARRNHRFRPRLFIRTLAAVRRVGLGETDAARRLPRLGARRRDHRFRRRRR